MQLQKYELIYRKLALQHLKFSLIDDLAVVAGRMLFTPQEVWCSRVEGITTGLNW